MTPPRACCSSTMKSSAKATASSWPPRELSMGSTSCSPFLSTSTRPAPTSAPTRLPSPPATAISRYSMLARTSNGDGLTKRFLCA